MELGGKTSITWEKFKEVFNETYFPDLVRDQKVREFSDLVQGTMTVEEYAAKFVELSHFAPYLILDEPKKVSKFQKGLNDRSRPHIIAFGVGTFTKTVKRAMSLEEDFKCNPGSKEDEKKQEPSNYQHVDGRGQNSKKGFFKKSGNEGHYNGQGKGGSPQFGKKWPYIGCGKIHEGQTCMEGVKVCYTCKQLGHFARQCPTTKGSGSSSTPQYVKGNDEGKRVQGRVYPLST